MKTYKNIYKNICSLNNLKLAFKKSRKGKSSKPYVKLFEANLKQELNNLKQELELLKYRPKPLKRFIINDPKTRTIHASAFRDRVVYHALVNILEPIYEKIFIYDNFANRKNQGTHKAVIRFENFKRKISKNYQLVKNAYNNNLIKGYCLKADIKHYFKTVDHEILLEIIKRKIKDKKVVCLIKQILNNFDNKIQGMPLGNLTSQFFANIYLNELDYFVKHKLKIKYYLRYVDDFAILHNSKQQLKLWKEQISIYLKEKLRLELHKDKSKIIPLRNGINLLGYEIFGHYRLLRKRNLRFFKRKFNKNLELFEQGILSYEDFIEGLQGWFGYARWANTYNLRKNIIQKVNYLNSK
jgi:RNA-directed DNA polymerase